MITATSTYAAWAGPSGYSLSGGADADDDNDGVSNYDEYVFGLNPTTGTSVNSKTCDKVTWSDSAGLARTASIVQINGDASTTGGYLTQFTYNDGSAGIVLCSSDAGVLAVVNADLAASNLPKTSAFVPLLAELVEQMLDRHRAADSALCGEPLVAHLPAETGAAAGLCVRGPNDRGPDSNAGRYGELADEAVGVAWRWTATGPPGIYRVERDGSPAPVFSMAVNIPAEESQLDVLPPDVLTSRLAAGRTVVYHGIIDEGQQRDDFWKWFAVACVVCILGEVSALLIFRT
jgi:hypothetical protein